MNMNKKILAYILLPLFFACSEEESLSPDVPSAGGKTIEVPVSINLSGVAVNDMRGTRTTGDTPPVPPMEGVAEVDVVNLYVFVNTNSNAEQTGNSDAGQYMYEQTITLTNLQDGGTHTDGQHSETDKEAAGKITLNTAYSYRILAIAHNSKSYGYNADFTKGETSLTEANISLANGNNTPELFACYLFDENAGGDKGDYVYSAWLPVKVSENSKLSGNLYRAVGRVEIELYKVDKDVKELQFIVEKFATSKEVYDQEMNAELGGKVYAYPMGYVRQANAQNATVATYGVTDNDGTKTATLSSFFFPLGDLEPDGTSGGYAAADRVSNRGHFYIKAIREDGSETTYTIKASISDYEESIWHGFIQYYVLDYQFIVPVNRKIRIYGDFEKLKSMDSDLSMDLGDMEVVEGGTLNPTNEELAK